MILEVDLSNREYFRKNTYLPTSLTTKTTPLLSTSQDKTVERDGRTIREKFLLCYNFEILSIS